MVTDDQRREVAARFRSYDVAAFKESTIVPFLDCLGVGYLGWRGIFDSLADLIDRPTTRDVADFDHESFKCTHCGYRVLSISGNPDHAKLVAPEGGVIDFGYCPSCGAEVIDEDGAN